MPREAKVTVADLEHDPAARDTLVRTLLTWYDDTHRDLPWRRTRDPYAIWVSEVLLQQTQVATVVPYYERFLAAFPTVHDLAAAPLDRVLALWQGLGYYARARNLHRAAQLIVERHGGEIPRDERALRALPGVGPYIAGAVLSVAYGQDEVAIDANIARVLARLFDYAEDPTTSAGQRALYDYAWLLLPPGRAGAFNVAIMELGATVCVARRPLCPSCPVELLCLARQRGVERERPVRRPKRAVPVRHLAAAYCRDGDRVLLVRRVPQGLLGGMWDLPVCEVPAGEDPAVAGEDPAVAEADPAGVLRQCLAEHLGLEVEVGAQVAEVHHGYSHFSVVVAVYACRVPGAPRQMAAPPRPGGPWDAVAWPTPAERGAFGLTGVARKALAAVDWA